MDLCKFVTNCLVQYIVVSTQEHVPYVSIANLKYMYIVHVMLAPFSSKSMNDTPYLLYTYMYM